MAERGEKIEESDGRETREVRSRRGREASLLGLSSQNPIRHRCGV